MKEHGIIFQGWGVRAIREGRKTQTRRVIRPQPIAVYRLTDDSIRVYHKDYETRTETNTRIAERRLPGGIGWEDLLVHQIRWIWAQGSRGLVPITGTPDTEGIPDGIAVPRKSEGYQGCAPADLLRLSRTASDALYTDQTPEWKSRRQPPPESPMGNTGGELGRQTSSRARMPGREAPDGEADRQGTRSYSVGSRQGIMQSASSSANAWYVSVGHIRCVPWIVGDFAWVREAWAPNEVLPLSDRPPGHVIYRADDRYDATWRPSIHMPRWASRLTLRLTDVRVQRVQEISEEDARAEGTTGLVGAMTGFPYAWDSINAKRGYGWETNPWVWALTFELVERAEARR